jgi:hypothetical protein
LHLAERLYGRRPRAYLLTVGAACFEEGTSLSLEVEAALDPLLSEVNRLVSAA